MKKYLVIEGRVHPSHYISDLGETIPYGREVRLSYEKAQWSRDLATALQQKSVIKKSVLTVQDTPPEVVNPVRGSQRRKSPKTVPSKKTDASQEMLEQSLRANETLREMNKELATTTNRLLAKQDILIDKLNTYMDRPVQVVSAGIPSSTRTSTYEVDEDVPTFVPSKIRSGKAKASKSREVQSESKEASTQLNSAAEALKSLRKGKDE